MTVSRCADRLSRVYTTLWPLVACGLLIVPLTLHLGPTALSNQALLRYKHTTNPHIDGFEFTRTTLRTEEADVDALERWLNATQARMSFSNSTDLALFDQAHDLQRRGIGDTIIKYLKKGIQALPPLCELGNIFDLFNVDPNDTSLLSELEGLAGALCSLIVPKRNNNNKRMLSLPYAEERFAIDGGSMERKIELSPFALCYIEETELAHHRSCVWSGNVNRSDIWSSHVADDSSLRHVPVALAILSALHLLAAAIAVTQLIRNISGHRLHPSLHHSMRNAATVAILILCEMAVLLILAFRLGPPGSVRFASGFDALTGTTALAILGMVTTDRSEDQAYAYESASDPYEVVLSDDEKTNTPV